MTDPISEGGGGAVPPALRELLERWRTEAERHKKHGDCYRVGQGWGLAECADELEAALGGVPVPAPQVDEKGPHIRAVEYARAHVVPLYRGEESLTPYERGMVRQVAAHYLAGYFAATELGDAFGVAVPPPPQET